MLREIFGRELSTVINFGTHLICIVTYLHRTLCFCVFVSDIDECERYGNSLCPAKSVCINLDATQEGDEDGYLCQCYSGYIMNANGTKCVPDGYTLS